MNYLGAEDDSILVKEESEVAGEVEATSQPLAWRYIEQGTAILGHLTQTSNGLLEGLGVGGLAIADSAEVDQRGRMCPACGGLVDHRLQKSGLPAFHQACGQ